MNFEMWSSFTLAASKYFRQASHSPIHKQIDIPMSGSCCHARCCLSRRGSPSFLKTLQHEESWSLGSNHTMLYQLSQQPPSCSERQQHNVNTTCWKWIKQLLPRDESVNLTKKTKLFRHINKTFMFAQFQWNTYSLWKPSGAKVWLAYGAGRQ